MKSAGSRLRALIEAPEIAVLPGVHDTLSALVAELSGAKALAAGGYSATASLLGRPDSSQLSLTELADFYARITERVSVPLLADADTGFGNVTNVARTVSMMERAGVGAFFIEDQAFPKRCGHMAGKVVVEVEEMAGKLKALLDSRQDETVMIMPARTPSRRTAFRPRWTGCRSIAKSVRTSSSWKLPPIWTSCVASPPNLMARA